MSPVMLLLLVLGTAGFLGIMYGCYRLYRSGEMDDELEERRLLAEEAARAEELEKLYPSTSAKTNKDKVKKFSERT
jgi:hypothetical protein